MYVVCVGVCEQFDEEIPYLTLKDNSIPFLDFHKFSLLTLVLLLIPYFISVASVSKAGQKDL